MAKQLIMLSSITYAMKAKDFLSARGIRACIERTPRELSSAGCGYSIRVDSDREAVARMLADVGIKVLGTTEVY